MSASCRVHQTKKRRRAPLSWGRSGGLLVHLRRGIHLLHVVQAFERVEQSLHARGLVAGELDHVLGLHRHFAELGGGYTFDTRPRQSLTLDWKAGYAAGTAEDADFARTTVDARVALRVPPGGVALRARGGEVNADAPTGELFYVGGTASPFVDPIALGNRIEQLGLPFGILGGRRYGILTAETVGPVRVFHDWMVGGDDELGETLRVVGAEVAFDVARLSVLRIPNANFRIGVNHSLNGPARNVTQVYSSFSVRP